MYIPLFYNKSNYANISGIFTKEIYHTLVGYKDLKLSAGKDKSDAVLIGILESPAKMSDSISSTGVKSVKNTYGEDALGDREDFFVPTFNNMRVSLRLIVIKHPTANEIKFLQTQMGKGALNSKIIFNESIGLDRGYLLKQLDGESVKVLGTQNDGLERENLKLLAKQAADSFRNMILYAF